MTTGTGQFVSDLVGTPNCWLSHAAAHLMINDPGQVPINDSKYMKNSHPSRLIEDQHQPRHSLNHNTLKLKPILCLVQMSHCNFITGMDPDKPKNDKHYNIIIAT